MKKRDKRLRASPEKRVFKVGGNMKSDIEDKVTIVFINVGLGRQKTASRFMVHLKQGKMACSEIQQRMEKAFGDLQ